MTLTTWLGLAAAACTTICLCAAGDEGVAVEIDLRHLARHVHADDHRDRAVADLRSDAVRPAVDRGQRGDAMSGGSILILKLRHG